MMAKLPELDIDPTLEAADKILEDSENAHPSRTYLGMSSIGRPCRRELWNNFRWVAKPYFNAKTHRRFLDGHHGEDVQAKRLMAVPQVRLRVLDPRTGKQIGFKDLGGHFAGHMDGEIVGLLQSPKTTHVWEHKQVNDDKFKKLNKYKAELGEKQALAKWDEVYYAQAVLYMHYSGHRRHYLTATTPGGRESTSARTESNDMQAKALIDKARGIILATEPPQKISETPAWYQCKICSYSDNCHGTKVAEVNCRTCVSLTPLMDSNEGQWKCERYNVLVDTEHQRMGCRSHLFIPALVPFAKAVDGGEDFVEYEITESNATDSSVRFRNVPSDKASKGCYSSWEISSSDPSLLGDDGLDEIRERFEATIVKD